jgi:type VI protein secretion system component VasF
MSFVPIVTPPPPPSPRARELARRIAEAIEQFRHEQPGTSSTDVRQALHLAAASSGTAQKLVVTLILAGLVLLAVLLFIFLKQA